MTGAAIFPAKSPKASQWISNSANFLLRPSLSWSCFRFVNLKTIDLMLRPLARSLAREADAILDLRELLLNQGHPGKCVRCFFRLYEAADGGLVQDLAPLRAWLETNVEISVRREGEELETLPFAPAKHEDLEAFCMRSIGLIRMDRGYQGKHLQLAFRYKALAA